MNFTDGLIWINLFFTICLLALGIGNNLKLYNVMATIKEISAKVDELQTALDAEQEQIKAAIDKLTAVITELETGGGTAEERQAVLDKLTAIKTDLESTIPDETPPTT